ncbi:MAG: TolC family protein [Deltaproteobacteria bacterium]|nr:TolC family protein [Deltaproteobacteria bacterium]
MITKKSFLGLGLLVLILTLLSQVTEAEETTVYTLERSVEEALRNNWGLKAEKEKIEQAVEVMKQSKAEFFPKLSTTYGYVRDSEARTSRSTLGGGREIAVSSQDNWRWTGTIRQPIFTGFSLISSYRLAQLGIQQSEMNYEQRRLDLALSTKEAYFNILIADKAVEVAEKDVEARESSANVARNFYKVGLIPINELLQAEVELANAQQALIRARNGAQQARAAFNTLLARPIDSPVEVEDILEYKPEIGTYEEHYERALKQRPEIKLIDNGLLQADQQLRLAKGKFLPEVAFTYNYVKEGDDPSVDGSPFHDAGRWEALVSLQWTFWEWGKTKAEVREKEKLKIELTKTRKDLEENIGLEIKSAMLDLLTAEKNIPTTKKAVEQGEENLRVSEERYRAQVTTITEVLDAQTRLTQSRVNYFSALYDYHLASSRLLRAIGTY